MGQNQLFLIILGVVVTLIAVTIGIDRFSSMTIDANRDAVIADLVNYGAKAQLYFRSSTTLGGGEQDYNGFTLNAIDQSNANGNYNVTATAPTGTAAVTPGGAISASATTIYIEGSGNEIGNDGTNPVKAFVTITTNTITTSILN